MARHTPIAMAAALLVVTLAQTGELPDPAKIKPVELFRTPDPCDAVCFGHAPSDFNGFVNSGKRVIRFSPDGKKRQDWFDCPAPAGHLQMRAGHALIDRDLKAIRWLSNGGGVHRTISTGTSDRPFRGPKGLALYLEREGHPSGLILGGGLYVSDPGDSSIDKPTGAIYVVETKFFQKTGLIAEGLAYPHGMVLSIDARTLFVAERDRNRILAFPVKDRKPGSLGKPEVFAELPKKDPANGQFDNQPCGLCLDAAGNLYVAHAGMGQIQVLNPKGELVRSYDAGMPWPTSVAFRGLPVPHGSLFVAGATGERRDGGAVFRLDLGVEGLDMIEDTF